MHLISSHPLSPIPIEVLVLGLNFGPSILHTPPNPALTQTTTPLISKPPFDKSNFMCLMVLSPNVKPTYTLMPSHISWHSTPCPAHSPFVLQTSGKPNHVVRATNSGYTKPCATFSPQEHSMYQTTCPHSTNHLQHHPTKGQHDTLFGSINPPFK